MLPDALTALLAACVTLLWTGGQDSSKVGTVSLVEVRPVVECSDLTGPPMGIPGKKSKFCLGRQIILSLDDIKSVIVFADTAQPQATYWVEAHLDSSGSRKLFEYTRANIRTRMGIVFKGTLLTAPMIISPSRSGVLNLKDCSDKGEASQIVDEITRALKQ